jgi:hypothetical protein
VNGETASQYGALPRLVIELGYVVAMRVESGQRRSLEAVTEEKLAARLAKVAERLEADAPNMERLSADLVPNHLSPDQFLIQAQWSGKHPRTQRGLCERSADPVIGTIGNRRYWSIPPGPSAADVARLG